MNVSTDLRIWLSAFMTLSVLSFLYKENPFFRFAENAFIGFGGGHALVLGYQTVRDSAVLPVKNGSYIQMVPILIGLVLYARFFKGGRPVSAIPVAFLYGLGIGITVPALALTQIVGQMAQTVFVPQSFNDVVIIAGVILTLSYFVFTFTHVPAVGKVSRIGRAFIMLAFGAQFGNYVMGRSATFTGRIHFLLNDWLGLVK